VSPIFQRVTAFSASLLSTAVFAFSQQEMTPEDAAAGVAACIGCWVIPTIIFLVLIALNIALLIWVARDAKARGMDSAAIWMILVMFTSVLGLIIYLFSRPQGELIQCPHCRNKRLLASAICPHCGNA